MIIRRVATEAFLVEEGKRASLVERLVCLCACCTVLVW